MEWIKVAVDDYATEKMFAVLYNQGPWAANIKDILDKCTGKQIDSGCVSLRPDYPEQITGYIKLLENEIDNGNLYDEMITEADVKEYARQLAPLFISTKNNVKALEDAAAKGFNAVANGKTEVNF